VNNNKKVLWTYDTFGIGRWPSLLALFFCASLFILGVLIVFSNRSFTYDEPIFLANTKLLGEMGFGKQFLREMHDQSPGPLYQLVHNAFKPITHLQPLQMRLFNLALFILCLFCLRWGLSLRGFNHSFLRAATLISVPMNWVLAGLALSEMPAMLMVTLSIVLLGWSISSSFRDKPAQRFLVAVVGGLLLGIGITGRTHYLAIIPAACVLLFNSSSRWQSFLFIISAMLFPLGLFSAWGGLVPPDVQHLQSGLNLSYGVWALAYAGLVTLIVAPAWFKLPRQLYFVACMVALIFFLINLGFQAVTFAPLQSVAARCLPKLIYSTYIHLAPIILIGFASSYLVACLAHGWTCKKDIWFVFLLLAILMMLAATVKSAAQFSSRYVGQVSPLLILCLSRYDNFDCLKLPRAVFGVLLGAGALLSYLYF
jgi:hypothetical protein